MIALYHRVFRRENFETAANDLMGLLYTAQEKQPNEPRVLYVDIDGHKNEVGGFDDDMVELQLDFGVKVLLQFVEELHFPMYAIKNPKEQKNNSPKKLVIENQRNERDTSLEELYIENYANTEFLSEVDVYEYMKTVSVFLKQYKEMIKYQGKKEEYDVFGWLAMWRKHMNELAVELFNSFVFGNYLSVAAMTRSLIECYIYGSILKKEKSQLLIDEWWICNMIHKALEDESQVDIIKEYCKLHKLDFEEKWKYYSKAKGGAAWLKELMGSRGIGVNALCIYIGEEDVYRDYQNSSDFVHGQDIATKMSPFTWYSSIYLRLYLMMTYIFKTIRLFDNDVEKELRELEYGLRELGKKYIDKNKGELYTT